MYTLSYYKNKPRNFSHLECSRKIGFRVDFGGTDSTHQWRMLEQGPSGFGPSLPNKTGQGENMRFMIIVKATKDTEAGVMPQESMFAAMATYHEELAKAGVLLDASGLKPSSKGWRVKYSGKKRAVIDGPFTESKELIAGYTMIQVKTKEEALEWSRRFPNPVGEGLDAEIEVRQLFEMEDFEKSEATDRFRKMEAERKK
jgi:hypothetical protein